MYLGAAGGGLAYCTKCLLSTAGGEITAIAEQTFTLDPHSRTSNEIYSRAHGGAILSSAKGQQEASCSA